jgi:hypothetical protein
LSQMINLILYLKKMQELHSFEVPIYCLRWNIMGYKVPSINNRKNPTTCFFTDALPSSLLDSSWVQVSQAVE